MPILTLTTDIGQRDYLAGAIKGQFLSLLPTLNIAISRIISPKPIFRRRLIPAIMHSNITLRELFTW
jgi:S-adenosylmethionine hydrolase